MKTIELNLKKRLLIVEVPRLEDYEFINKDSKYLKVGNVEINLNIHTLSKLELICKGCELTEGICETLISKKDVAKYQSKMCGLKFKDGLIKMIESKGCKFDLNKTLIFEIL